MQADVTRRLQINIQIEQAFKAIRFIARPHKLGSPIAVIRLEKFPWVLVVVGDIGGEFVNQFRFDGIAPDQPAMIDKMCQVPLLRRRDGFAGAQFLQPIRGIKPVRPECG